MRVDHGYQGPKMAKAVANTGCRTLQIVKCSDAHRFVVLPKRWFVERTFACISRNRCLARDFERYARTVAAFVRLAMIRIMLKRCFGRYGFPDFRASGVPTLVNCCEPSPLGISAIHV